MLVTLLGTGSADGWPNPFCECASCVAERRSGRSRRPSSALVDGRVLIDCGPGATHAANAAGVSLRAVEHVLLTHGHPDHLDPAFLLARHWAGAVAPLHIWGPAHALDLCRDWVAPGSPVHLHVIEPGEHVVLEVAGRDYRVGVLPAAHSSGDGDRLADEAVLFVVTAPDGQRLLYATDTGPLPDSTVALIGGAVDAVLLDATFGDTLDHGTGHLDLATLPEVVDALRSAGVVTTSTHVVATHLSHHNPPTAVLRDRLGAHGVRVPDDLDVIDTTASPTLTGRRVLLIGGARSGKSAHAERLAAAWGRPVTYVATGGARPDDADWEARVAAHRSRRPRDWTTVETTDLASALRAGACGSTMLVDCLTLWLTAQLDELDAWRRAESGDAADIQADVLRRTADLVDALRASPADVILVTNEVGWGVVPATAAGRLFRDVMGRVNTEVARACDETILLVAGHRMPLEALAGPFLHDDAGEG